MALKKDAILYQNWLEMRLAIGLEDDKQFVIQKLRHTCCTRLISAGIDLRSVQERMRHEALDVTQRYAHFIPSKLVDAADALSRLRTGTQNRSGLFHKYLLSFKKRE